MAGTLHIEAAGRSWTFGPSRAVLIGRGADCDVTVTDELVSRRHLEVRPEAGGWVVADLSSRNGTWVDGASRNGAVLRPGAELRARLGDDEGPELVLRAEPEDDRCTSGRTLVIGRDPGCDVVVEDPLVSRRHAVVECGRETLLSDLGSHNGTYCNGAPVTAPVPLRSGDRVGVGNATLVWTGRGLSAGPPLTPSLDARHLTVTTPAGTVLLDDVSLTFPAGSLTAVIGPSGAGKSTLMGALTGLRPASQGHVRWSGHDLYAEYAQLRRLVGLVPQEDIVHRQLTVARALRFAAQLRLPPDVDHEARIDEVLAEVGLTGQKGQRIDSLSGGQLKRTSIALELLTAPRLLFLDEPTSGLDPGLDRQVMLGLRALADAGRVVVVVTHSVLALDACDRVVLLAPGGRVAFSGPPAELLPYFGATGYHQVFDALQDPSWVQRYAASSMRVAYVGRTDLHSTPAPAGDVAAPPRPAPLRQWWTLTRRNLAVAAADRMFVGLLVAMPVVLALMARAFPGDAGLSMPAPGEVPLEAQQRLLVLVVGAALMGATLSMRELVVERPIYRREHAVGLHPAAYLASKVVVLGSLVAAQAVAFTLLALYRIPPPEVSLVLPGGRVELAAAVASVAVVMTLAALAVSAAARSAEQTMPALVALVMAQMVFCGGLFAITGRPGIEQLSWFLPARFGYAAGAATVGWQRSPTPQPDPFFEPTQQQWLFDMGVLGAQAVVLVLLTSVFLARSVARGGRR